jgi:hypothetical protein
VIDDKIRKNTLALQLARLDELHAHPTVMCSVALW